MSVKLKKRQKRFQNLLNTCFRKSSIYYFFFFKMSSPQIEREVEDVESEQKRGFCDEEDETEQQQQSTEKPVKNVDEHVDGELDNTGEASVSQTSKPIYASKTVKKLSNDERSMLMNKFEKGVEDPYFKVIRMSNGAIRITKRRNPIVADVKQAQEERSTRISNKVSRLTNEQLLMEHIIDLETRFESMRLKHKKLKKRYNELENSIYEDVDTRVDAVVDESQPQSHVQQPAEEPPETHENSNARTGANEVSAGAYTQKRRLKKSSWRDAIDYM
jgi:hypothetical protein